MKPCTHAPIIINGIFVFVWRSTMLVNVNWFTEFDGFLRNWKGILLSNRKWFIFFFFIWNSPNQEVLRGISKAILRRNIQNTKLMLIEMLNEACIVWYASNKFIFTFLLSKSIWKKWEKSRKNKKKKMQKKTRKIKQKILCSQKSFWEKSLKIKWKILNSIEKRSNKNVLCIWCVHCSYRICCAVIGFAIMSKKSKFCVEWEKTNWEKTTFVEFRSENRIARYVLMSLWCCFCQRCHLI